jgi:3-deoxy-7-phosphoheptulonate synthase
MGAFMSQAAKLVMKQSADDNISVRLNHGLHIGSGSFTVVAGPCAVESSEQLDITAKAIHRAGAHALRGGAFKPRTSPYSFQGLGELGLQLLRSQGESLKLPVISEIMSENQLALMEPNVDAFQVGARNMQNFSLLRALSKTQKPVFLKRHFAATLEEWLLAAEYLLEGGNENVILVERGIRTFDSTLRNTLDLAGMVWVKQRTRLPVLVDPSHATGNRALVIPMSLAAAAAGADGIMVEVHHAPEKALSDGPQALTPDMFSQLMERLEALLNSLGKSLFRQGPKALVGGVK